MNTLSRLDSSLSHILFRPSYHPPPASAVAGPSHVPTGVARRASGSHPRLSELPPRPKSRHRRRSKVRPKPTTAYVKVPPPSTPILLRLVLVLWGILLGFWQSLVGQTRAERFQRRKRRSTLLRELSSDDGTEATTEGEGEVLEMARRRWRISRRVDLDESDADTTTTESSAKRKADPDTLSFRLRSAPANGDKSKDRPATEKQEKHPLAPSPRPPSILSNPVSSSKPAADSADADKKRNRLLPNPISTSVLDPSVPPSNISSLTAQRPNQTPFFRKKALILVLDLDETLIHSTSRPLGYAAASTGGGGLLGLSFGGWFGGGKSGRAGHTIEVVLNGRSTTYHVYKRPHVDHFLKKVANWYTLVIFTASMPEYADPVIDWLDAGRNLFAKRFYRDSCHLQKNGSYVKDLTIVESDLARVCIMDNSPISYAWHKSNALPIESWTSDLDDQALLHCLPVLDSLRFVNDVRKVLGARTT